MRRRPQNPGEERNPKNLGEKPKIKVGDPKTSAGPQKPGVRTPKSSGSPIKPGVGTPKSSGGDLKNLGEAPQKPRGDPRTWGELQDTIGQFPKGLSGVCQGDAELVPKLIPATVGVSPWGTPKSQGAPPK